MEAQTLFFALKTQDVPVNCLRSGDIVDLDHTVAMIRTTTHYNKGEYKDEKRECIVLEFEGDDTGELIVPANLPGGPKTKWCDFTIVVRESLAEKE